MHILLTNDDGIRALGLRDLYASLRKSGHKVTTVAPLTEQSAVGHAVTLFSPLRVKEIREKDFSGLGVVGTPADCVKLALGHLLSAKPDMIVSGINRGANVGVDILYSGTVSAATEGALARIPSLAVSVDDFKPEDLSSQADYSCRLIEQLPWADLPAQRVINLNFPRGNFADHKQLAICPQTQAVYEDVYDKRLDPRDNPYFWLHGQIPESQVKPGTDRELLTRGHITLTPLKFDFTDYKSIEKLSSADLNNI